jgi:hypothetical protein
MRVEFTLSFEDYLDWRKTGRPKFELGAAVSCAVIGGLLFGLAYLVVREGHPPSQLYAGYLMGLSLLIVFAAVPIGLLTPKREIKASTSQLQNEYRRHFSDQRIFEVDESGWKYKSSHGVDIHSWAELGGIQENDRVLVLSTDFDHYVLPKSAFAPSDLQGLQRRCDQAVSVPTKIFAFATELRSADYASAQISHGWRHRRSTMVLWYSLGVAGVIFFGTRAAEETELGRTLYLVLFAVVVLVLVIGQRLLYWWHFKSRLTQARFNSIEVCQDRLRFLGAGRTWVSKFRWIERVDETRRVLMLYISANRFWILPKADLTGEQLKILREQLSSALKSNVGA